METLTLRQPTGAVVGAPRFAPPPPPRPAPLGLTREERLLSPGEDWKVEAPTSSENEVKGAGERRIREPRVFPCRRPLVPVVGEVLGHLKRHSSQLPAGEEGGDLREVEGAGIAGRGDLPSKGLGFVPPSCP